MRTFLLKALKAAAFLVAGFCVLPPVIRFDWRVCAAAQQRATAHSEEIVVEGTVRDAAGKPAEGASVILAAKDGGEPVKTKTGARGEFRFVARQPGAYWLRAERAGAESSAGISIELVGGEQKRVALVLGKRATDASAAGIEFADNPSFTVAGVNDGTDVGGHGSDTTRRTSESLARETAALKTGERGSGAAAKGEAELRAALAKDPGSFAANRELGLFCLAAKNYREAIPLLETAERLRPEDAKSAYDLGFAYAASGELAEAKVRAQKLLASANSGEAHRLLGEIAERSGDPVGAVREYELAVRAEPSEQNYFAWGAELLLHGAPRPAVEVFSNGAKAHAASARMLAGLGAALYASGSVEEAARRLCQASDLSPADAAPYLLLGTIEKSSTGQLPCAAEKLQRFAKTQPTNALANYDYAMSLLKRAHDSAGGDAAKQAEALLEKAVALNPALAEAHLQLGILYSQRGETQRAVAAFEKAIAADPAIQEAHYRLGLVYKRGGENAKAEREFQLYREAQNAETAAVEARRRELRQFLIILRDQPESIAPR